MHALYDWCIGAGSLKGEIMRDAFDLKSSDEVDCGQSTRYTDDESLNATYIGWLNPFRYSGVWSRALLIKSKIRAQRANSDWWNMSPCLAIISESPLPFNWIRPEKSAELYCKLLWRNACSSSPRFGIPARFDDFL